MKESPLHKKPSEPPVDDVRFRREILLFAQQMLHNLDTREEELSRFQALDQPAFREWVQENFKTSLEKLAQLENEHAEAVHFHNTMVAVTKLFKVSMPQAFLRLKEEQETYAHGSLAQRRQIDEERRKRENFLRVDQPGEARPTIAATPAETAPETEAARQVYRRLARRLHPDLQGPGVDAIEQRWQTKVWHTAQMARQRGDVAELQRLYKVTLLRQMEFSELTIADAHEICAYLKSELDRLTLSLESARQNPAYDFTRRPDRDQYRQTIKERLANEIESLEKEIKDLKGQHAYVEILSHSEYKPRRSRRKGTARGSSDQLSLFDWA